MPATSQRARPRRALPPRTAHVWLERGLAALAVSALGVGMAASLVLTGSAQGTTPAAQPSVAASTVPGVAVPDAFDPRAIRTERTDRSTGRPALTAQLLAARTKALAADAKAVAQESEDRAKEKAQEKKAAEKKRREALGTPTLPVTSRYSIVARFGDVGAWARYHTGFDFSAPIGTPIHAPSAGVVTTAGSGVAGGWAGTYVTIQHPDGTTTLYAHMSVVSVAVGQRVKGGDVIGQIGMTGRAFGPHLHFEVYPFGSDLSDVYTAVDPAPWLARLGLHP